jgi:signal transduction histidine kinase
VGLGLAITERAVRFHGGRVAATNRAAGGLMVEIYLPLMPASPEPERTLETVPTEVVSGQ